MTTFLTRAQVARMLGISPPTLDRRRTALEDEQGFPLPMPHSLRPLLWRRAQVDLWIEAHGRPKTQPAGQRPIGSNIILLEEARRA